MKIVNQERDGARVEAVVQALSMLDPSFMRGIDAAAINSMCKNDLRTEQLMPGEVITSGDGGGAVRLARGDAFGLRAGLR